MPRQRFDSAVQSSIELRNWDKVRLNLVKDSSTPEKKRSHKIYKRDMSALHLACQYDPPADIVKLLIEANPDAILMRSQPHGDLPLHFATGYNTASVEVIRQLVDANASTVAVQNTFGVSPLHQACLFHAPYDVIKVMVEASPEAVYIEDAQGRTPWDIAKVNYFFLSPWNWKVLYLLAGGRHKRIKGKAYVFPKSP